MTDKKDSKEFVDPATASALCVFAIKSIAQAIIGWLGLEFFKKNLDWLKNWYNKRYDKHIKSIFRKKS